MKKIAEVVFIPFPGVGHLVSALEFVKLLINRDDRLRITVLVLKFPHTGSETDGYTDSLIASSSDRVRVINLPECSVPPTSDVGSSMNALLEAQKPSVKEAVSNLTAPLAAFVVDMFCTTMIDVAKEFGVPALVFLTSGVAFLGLMLHLHTIRERDNVDAAQLQDSLTEVTIPSFSNPVPSNALPSAVLRKEFESFFISYGRGLKKANGFIVNSFEELEPYAVHSFFSDPGLGGLPIYPVGPILNPKAKATADFDDKLKSWLDHQPPSSVIFLCFGSRGSFDEDQVREIARAIEDSGARFLWSMRKPPPKGTMGSPSDYTLPDLAAVLPEGFLDRTAEIGRVIGWAPQAQVLAHPATGGFVSHCGWNSTLESIYFGVPIATWPLFAEQQANAFELVCELKMAVEIALDYRVELNAGRNYLLTADKIERGIRSLLDKEDGEEIRKKVKEMSEKSRKTLLEGGSSYTHLGRFIDYVMNQVIRELSGVILSRAPKLCNFVEWRGYKVVYKRYASLYFCKCIDDEDNELEVLEMIHHYVEILDRYFGSVCELDLIFNFHKAYYILDELLIAGELQESSKKTVARLIAAQDSLVETAKEEAGSLSNIIAQATK